MKVLTFLTNIDQTKGGPSRSVPMFVRGLSQVGVDITLMIIKSGDMNLHALDGTTAKIHLLPPNYTKMHLEEFVAREKFDLIHGQCIWEPLFHQMLQVADKYGIPYISTPRGTLEPWSLQQKKWKKRIARWLYQDKDLRRAACIYTTAVMEAEHIRELGFKNPICIIPNGIETDGYPCRKDISMEKKQILFLSRIHPKKGIEILIDAFAGLHKDYPDWIVTIVGNGDAVYIESLKAKVKNLGLETVVQLLPPVYGDAKIRLYQESSIFCLPSYSENFGMVIAEAMSCGLPVITTNNTPWQVLNGASGMIESIGDERIGWCIDLTLENLAMTLKEAMSLPAESLFQLGQRGSRLISENFNYQKVAIKNRDLYKWILNGGEKPSFVLE